MRETRQSGSEGGGACGAPYPYPDGATSARFPSMQQALRSQNGLHPIARDAGGLDRDRTPGYLAR